MNKEIPPSAETPVASTATPEQQWSDWTNALWESVSVNLGGNVGMVVLEQQTMRSSREKLCCSCDLPEATDDQIEEEETVPERKPICSFVNRQTVFAIIDGESVLKEFPMPEDELHLGGRFEAYGGLLRGAVVSYVLNRRPEFKHPFYGWGKIRG